MCKDGGLDAMTPSPPPAELLAHAVFVRRLAGALLRDDAEADDAAQEAIVRSIEHPPGRPAEGTGWIAAILRNVVRRRHRGETRARVREASVARREAIAGPGDLAARSEIVRRIADAVAGLDAPAREVVLLRHYEGLAPREIAVRLAQPVETVKSRLKRAHARLRERLDERRGGNVEGWRVALAALVGVGVGSSAGVAAAAGETTGGGLVMGTGAKIGVGAAIAVVVGMGAWGIAARSKDESARPTTVPTMVAATDTPAPPAAPPPELAPPPGRSAAPVAAREDGALPAGWSWHAAGSWSVAIPDAWKEQPGAPGAFTWGVLGADGRPELAFGLLPAETIEPMRKGLEVRSTRRIDILGVGATWTEGATRAGIGALVTFDATPPGGTAVCFVVMAAESRWTEVAAIAERSLGLLRTIPPPPAPPVPPATLPASIDEPTKAQWTAWRAPVAGDRVEGRVVLGTRPIAGATVTLFIQMGGGPASRFGQGDEVRRGRTDARGEFSWSGVEPASWRVEVDAPGLGRRRTFVQTKAAPETIQPIVVVFGGGEIAGRAYLRDGRPAAGAVVEDHPQSPRDRDAAYGVAAETTTAEDGSYRLAGLASGLHVISVDVGAGADATPGSDRREEAVELGANESKRLDLGSAKPEARWTGTMRLSSGTPIDGRGRSVSLTRVSTRMPIFLEARPASGGLIDRRLPAGTYRIDVGFAAQAKPFTASLTIGDADVVQDLVVPGVRIAGRVVDKATGRAISFDDPRGAPGVTLKALNVHPPAVFPGWVDSEGAFTFDAVLPGGYRLIAGAPVGREGESAPVDVTVEDRDVTGVTLELVLK